MPDNESSLPFMPTPGDISCPVCGAVTTPQSEVCAVCGASLNPPDDASPGRAEGRAKKPGGSDGNGSGRRHR